MTWNVVQEVSPEKRPRLLADCKEDGHGNMEELLTLFSSLETVLGLYYGRRNVQSFAATRENVEEMTGLSLDEARLVKILAVAGDMLNVTWAGEGLDAVMELRQVTDGQLRPPTAIEGRDRLQRFKTSLQAPKAWREVQLPARPWRSLVPVRELLHRSEGELPTSPAVEKPAPCGSPSDRLEAVRQRVLLRQGQLQRQQNLDAFVKNLAKRSGDVENAIFAHSLICYVFAYGKTSTREVVEKLCSSRCTRPMSLVEAKAAVSCLLEVSEGWFLVEKSLYSPEEGFFLTQLPTGRPALAMSKLRSKLERIAEEKQKLLALGPDDFEKLSKATTTDGSMEQKATAISSGKAKRKGGC